MFSVQQKRDIANAVQQILRNIGHPELPVGEIEFMLHVQGRVEWSWAEIRNNAAIHIPSVNPYNETQAQKCTPPEPQHGRDVKSDNRKYNPLLSSTPFNHHGREPNKVKPLAEYLGEYIEHETGMDCHYGTWRELLEQALDAYESTEQVKVRIEPA